MPRGTGGANGEKRHSRMVYRSRAWLSASMRGGGGGERSYVVARVLATQREALAESEVLHASTSQLVINLTPQASLWSLPDGWLRAGMEDSTVLAKGC